MTLKCVSIYFIPCFWSERTSLEVFQKSASAWNLSPRRLFPVYLWSQVAANMLPSINQSRSIVAYFLINCANDLHMFGAGQAIDGSNIYKPGTAMLIVLMSASVCVIWRWKIKMFSHGLRPSELCGTSRCSKCQAKFPLRARGLWCCFTNVRGLLGPVGVYKMICFRFPFLVLVPFKNS